MKKIFIIKESVQDQITFYHLLVFVMALPFDRLYSELALISLSIHTLIHLTKNDYKHSRFSKIIIPAALYLLTVIGTLYTHYYNEAFFEWERQLAFLLFPLIFLYNSFDCKKYLFNILFGLAVSCTLTIVYLYYAAFAIIGFNHLPFSAIFDKAFLNHNFSAPIDMHATYFSMYIAVALVALIDHLIRSYSASDRILSGSMILVLLTGLLQLSSRSVFIAFAIVINVAIPFLIFSKKKRFISIMISSMFSLGIFALLSRVENVKNRFTIEFKEDLSVLGNSGASLEPRAVRWECAWELIKQAPLLGHGSGSEVALLKQVYFQRKLYHSFLNELNAHNEYLSLLLKTGILGLLVFFIPLVTGFKIAIRYRDLPFCAFLIIISVVSFSENILDANKGIFFMAFFYSFFYFAREDKVLLKNKIITIHP